jgi:hypothetical protein
LTKAFENKDLMRFCCNTALSIRLKSQSGGGHSITSRHSPPKADIAERDRHVRFVPTADIAGLLVFRREASAIAGLKD